MTSPLRGKSLLQLVDQHQRLGKKQLATKAGYKTPGQLVNALLAAQGLAMDDPAGHHGRGGREAQFRTRIQQNGNLLIGPAYTQLMGLMPGDTVEITLGRKHITLIPVIPVSETEQDITNLSKRQLLQTVNMTLPARQDAKLHELLDKKQTETLSAQEESQLMALLQLYEQGMLRKSAALAESACRGFGQVFQGE